jgi:uncharacterized membrane protein
MSIVQESVDVNVPVQTAYNQWTQFESFPEFMSGVSSVRQLDDKHLQWVVKVGGVKREFAAEITEQHPDERIAWKSTDGDVRQAGVVTFHRLNDNQTRVTIQLDWEPGGIVEQAGSLAQVDDLQVRADAKRFKSFIEERGHETGQWRGNVQRP